MASKRPAADDNESNNDDEADLAEYTDIVAHRVGKDHGKPQDQFRVKWANGVVDSESEWRPIGLFGSSNPQLFTICLAKKFPLISPRFHTWCAKQREKASANAKPQEKSASVKRVRSDTNTAAQQAAVSAGAAVAHAIAAVDEQRASDGDGIDATVRRVFALIDEAMFLRLEIMDAQIRAMSVIIDRQRAHEHASVPALARTPASAPVPASREASPSSASSHSSIRVPVPAAAAAPAAAPARVPVPPTATATTPAAPTRAPAPTTTPTAASRPQHSAVVQRRTPAAPAPKPCIYSLSLGQMSEILLGDAAHRSPHDAPDLLPLARFMYTLALAPNNFRILFEILDPTFARAARAPDADGDVAVATDTYVHIPRAVRDRLQTQYRFCGCSGVLAKCVSASR